MKKLKYILVLVGVLFITGCSKSNIKEISYNEYKDLILLNESLHEKRIAEIAGKIKKSGKRIILIAGL